MPISALERVLDIYDENGTCAAEFLPAMNARSRYFRGLLIGALLWTGARNCSAVQTWLALRSGCAMPVHCGVTVQTLSTSFGTNAAWLPFSATATYDFYSPPLSNSIFLVPSDKGGGVIYMHNTGTTSTNDFSVTGEMKFFDYNPATGTEVLIVDTTASPPKDVNHGQVVNWAIPNALLPTNTTIAAGHMVHIAMTIGLVSGNPAGCGEVLYNGPGPCTAGFLPQNRSTVLNWSYNQSAIYGPAAAIVSIVPQPNATVRLFCAGSASASYSIQATTNLLSPAWTTILTTNADSNGLFSFIDTGAARFPMRFYRTASQ
jgi:hypothetical protein